MSPLQMPIRLVSLKRLKNYRSILQDFQVLNDGIGVDLASRIKFGDPFPENLNGSDFIPYYFSSTRHRLRVFLLGAQPDVVEAAAHNFQKAYPLHTIVGWHHGYFQEDANASLCSKIKETGANVLLVGMGNPEQEYWIAKYGALSGASLMFGVGALFDFHVRTDCQGAEVDSAGPLRMAIQIGPRTEATI